jgi:hypothetical protein
LDFLDRFSKSPEISDFMKTHPVGAKVFHSERQTNGRTDRHTDRETDRQNNMTKVIFPFRDFAIALKKTVWFAKPKP